MIERTFRGLKKKTGDGALDVDLWNDAGNEKSDWPDARSESSPSSRLYHSLTAWTGPMPEAFSFMLKHGPLERMLRQSQRARHTHKLNLRDPIVNQALRTSSTSNDDISGMYAAHSEVYLVYSDDLLEPQETSPRGQETFNGDSSVPRSLIR